MMNRFLICSFFVLCSSLANAQINELGVFLGGANYTGEVGPSDFISPNELAFGIVYKWNRSPRHAYRFSYTHAKITSRDEESDSAGMIARDYDFENTINELSAGIEFNFFDFNLHEMERKLTPYVYTGLSYFFYNDLYVLDGATQKDEASSNFAIPMIVGLKSNITPNLILGFEAGARYTFTDNIDGSNPTNKNYRDLQFGNLESKDWYFFTGLTLTYTFGETPCYCAE